MKFFPFILLLALSASAQVIDHLAIPSVVSLPQFTLDQIATQRWYFIHASVGDNIMQGLVDLHRSNAVRYPLVVSTINSNPSPPSQSFPGTVYEHHFSSSKIPEFISMVTNGWHNPAVDIALMKFCYLDGLATSLTPAVQLASNYVAALTALEQAFPATVFVYVSMPLLIYRAEDDPRRDPNYLPSIVNINQFNDCLRAWCRVNNKLLYDLADIESHDPDGNPATFTWTNGLNYPVIYPPYVYNTPSPGSNSGHLIAPGRQQVARGWYALAAAIVNHQTPRPRLEWGWTANQLHLTWSGAGFFLQQSTNLAQSNAWQDVPDATQGSHTSTNQTAPALFYRLLKP